MTTTVSEIRALIPEFFNKRNMFYFGIRIKPRKHTMMKPPYPVYLYLRDEVPPNHPIKAWRFTNPPARLRRLNEEKFNLFLERYFDL